MHTQHRPCCLPCCSFLSCTESLHSKTLRGYLYRLHLVNPLTLGRTNMLKVGCVSYCLLLMRCGCCVHPVHWQHNSLLAPALHSRHRHHTHASADLERYHCLTAHLNALPQCPTLMRPCCLQALCLAAVLAVCLGVATAQPFAPGQGFLPSGSCSCCLCCGMHSVAAACLH